MAELWDYAEFSEEEEERLLSDSDEEVEVVDTDFLLPSSKRRKLQKQFTDVKRGRREAAVAEKPEQEQQPQRRGRKAAAEDADSDIDLLDLPPGNAGAAFPKPPAAAQQPAAARRPVLDPKSSTLLQQLKATQNAMLVAAAEVDLTADDGDEGEDLTEPSPVQLRHAGRWGSGGAQQRQQQGQAGGDDDDSGFEILEDNLEPVGANQGPGGAAAAVAAAAAAADDKIPLKLQSMKGTKVLKMRRTDPFSKMFEVYRKFAHQQGWIQSVDAPVRFNFDGDDVSPNDTPEDLDLEGEEMIEVRF